MSSREPVYEDLDRYFEREEYMNYLKETDLDENIIKSPTEAVQMLLDQMINGQSQSYDFLVRALQVLAKEYGLEKHFDIDESELKVNFESDMNSAINKIKEDQKDSQIRMLKHVKSLEEEVYGLDSVDPFTVDASLSSICWHLGVHRPSNRNVNIKRK